MPQEYRAGQVTDLPLVKPETTEYRMPVTRCACGHSTTAAAPDGVQVGQALYGPAIKTMIALLSEVGHVSQERTAQLMAQMFGCPVSTGFVAKVDAQLVRALAVFEDEVKEYLRGAPVAGIDEIPVSLPGATAYIYGMHDGKVVWYVAGTSRGHDTIKALEPLAGFGGVLVRDDYQGYYFLDGLLAGVRICAAHPLRDLVRAHERDSFTNAWAGTCAACCRKPSTPPTRLSGPGVTGCHPA